MLKVIEVQDIPAIMAYGVMSTPAIVIDEKVVSTGQGASQEPGDGDDSQGAGRLDR